MAPYHTQSSNLWHCSYHNCIISHTKFLANKLYHNRPQRHLAPISMFWSSSTNSQHSLNPSKRSLLMTRDSIVFSIKHKLQQCHNGNNALYSTLVLLWWSKTYFYPMSMSLDSDITTLWLWPRLGLTRTSPVSTELVAGKERVLGNALAKLLHVNQPQLNCWPVSWTFLWLGFSFILLPLWFYPVFDRASFGVDHVHNQTFSTVYGCSHGREEEYSRTICAGRLSVTYASCFPSLLT